jgi:hypothetical protein
MGRSIAFGGHFPLRFVAIEAGPRICKPCPLFILGFCPAFFVVLCFMNSRFNLGLRPATASSNSLFNRTADALDGNAPAFPDTFTLETLLVPAEASHSSVFALSLAQRAKFSPLCFQSVANVSSLFFTLFHSSQRS